MTAARDVPDMPGGLYGLFDLGGKPVESHDLAILHLPISATVDGAARALDAIAPADAHIQVERGRTTAFLGRIEERAEMADRLGLPRVTPQAELARAALDRFGADLPAELLGDWIMLDRPAAGPVRLLVGIGGRMPLLYARVGDRIAIAPSIHVLRRIGWIGHTLDDDAFLLSMTICTLDDDRAQQTILRGVRRVPRGGCVTIAQHRPPQVTVADPFVAVPRWTGSRRDAMGAAEALLRRVVRDRLAHAVSPGLLLSGGLDSSLIAWAIAEEGGAALPALSSAAGPERGVADETPYAAIVADTLGMPLHRVVPPADTEVYRPTAETLAASNIPPLSPRDYVYAAFADAAAALGVTELFDGAHGELTFTALMPVRFWRDWPRDRARDVRDALRRRWQPTPDRLDAVLDVALAAPRRASPSAALREAVASQAQERWTRRAGEPWGYSAGARPPLRRDARELRPGRLRLVRPFHDIRLLRLFAGFPAHFMVDEGMTRWPARAVLAGRLPDTIVRRASGMPFSPDYHLRLVEQAPVALARIDAFRAGGCDDWFDLAWLHDGLARVAAGRALGSDELLRVQMTAQACEFLTWWRNG